MKLPQKNLLEWIVFGISLVLTVGVIAALAWNSFQTDNGPPRFEVEMGAAERSSDGLRIPIRVTNIGDRMAEDVQVEVRIERGGQEERVELRFDRLARAEEVQGVALFAAAAGEPERSGVQVVSYSEP